MCEREILCAEDGSVELERRGFLKLSLWSVLHLSLGGPLLAAGEQIVRPQGWDELLRQWITDAEASVLLEGSEAEGRYLLRAEERLLNLVEDPGQRPGDRPKATLEGASFELLHQERPMLALRFHLQPGASLPVHDHRYQNGVMKVLGGDLEVRSFDALEDLTDRPSLAFAVRETARRRLLAGDVAVLSRRRNNIHGVTAGEHGATVLDIFTHYRPEAHSRRLEIDTLPMRSEESIYWAKVMGRF